MRNSNSFKGLKKKWNKQNVTHFCRKFKLPIHSIEIIKVMNGRWKLIFRIAWVIVF